MFVIACAGDTAPVRTIDKEKPDVHQHADADLIEDTVSVDDTSVDPLPDADASPQPDTTTEPDISADTGPDADPLPLSCTESADCVAPEICIIDATTGEGVCGARAGNTGADGICLDSSTCASGICRNGRCAQTCDSSEDCTEGRICKSITLGSITRDLCVDPTPCASDQQCTPPETCTVDRSGELVRVICLEPSASGKVGDTCTDDSACASNLCLNGVCSKPCESPSDCSDDGSFICTSQELASNSGQTRIVTACTPKPAQVCITDANCVGPERCVARSTDTGLMFVCGEPNAGGGEGGANCSDDTGCAQNLCHNNVCANPCGANANCDVANDFSCKVTQIERDGDTADLSVCQPPKLCANNNQCTVDQVCYIRKASDELRTFCRAGNTGGGALGTSCTTDANCASNLCFQGRFNKYCSPACVNNSDCQVAGVVTYECQEVSFTLSGGGSDTAKVCVAAAPPACSSQLDCATGTQCAIVANTTNTGLESVCIPAPGGSAAGATCTQDTQCRGRVCLNGNCSVPCTDRAQCGAAQVCRSNNVQKSGLSGTFNVCETLPDVECNATAGCTDGVRVCGALRFEGGVLKTYCTFPNSSGLALGETCTAHNQCRDMLCLAPLSLSNECSVACEISARDCNTAAGQICTTFGPDLGLCIATCTNNAGCDAGQSCNVNGNDRTNDIDYVCLQNVGTDLLGADCSTTNNCAGGLCLTSTLHTYNGTACTTNANCPASHSSCQCPLNNPGCTTGKQCALVETEKHCTYVCDPNNGNADCTGGVANNPLTACSSNITFPRPNGGEANISACAKP
ncbi:MAG: hypothetical protein H0U74_21720 [Bradymonadaceae bacterium]|nr:hypothetical protein [Lujinxingiaceae bacterium]